MSRSLCGTIIRNQTKSDSANDLENGLLKPVTWISGQPITEAGVRENIRDIKGYSDCDLIRFQGSSLTPRTAVIDFHFISSATLSRSSVLPRICNSRIRGLYRASAGLGEGFEKSVILKNLFSSAGHFAKLPFYSLYYLCVVKYLSEPLNRFVLMNPGLSGCSF